MMPPRKTTPNASRLLCVLTGLAATLHSASAGTCVVVGVIMDESGSMSGEQEWISTDVLPKLFSDIDAANFGPNYLCSTGYTTEGASYGCGEWDAAAYSNPYTTSRGGFEDGYNGIVFADAEVDALTVDSSCTSTIRVGILVTDEDRDEGTEDTLDSTIALLTADGWIMNSVIRSPLSGSLLGVTQTGATYTGYVSDGSGSFSTVPVEESPVSSSRSIATDYAPLAFATGGGVWDLSLLRGGGADAVAFTEAFIAIKLQEIIVSCDSDGDEVCDDADACPGFDDRLDADGDGVPDDCDACEGFDDAIDIDGNGVPDGCDIPPTPAPTTSRSLPTEPPTAPSTTAPVPATTPAPTAAPVVTTTSPPTEPPTTAAPAIGPTSAPTSSSSTEPPSTAAPTVMATLIGPDTCECSIPSECEVSTANAESLKMFDKCVEVSVDCISGDIMPSHCNMFGAGQACQGCFLSCEGAQEYLLSFPDTPAAEFHFCACSGLTYDLCFSAGDAPADSCVCDGYGESCFTDESCTGSGMLGCNVNGEKTCRFCGFGAYASIACP